VSRQAKDTILFMTFRLFLTLIQIENDFKMCLPMLATNENDTIKILFPEFLERWSRPIWTVTYLIMI